MAKYCHFRENQKAKSKNWIILNLIKTLKGINQNI